MKLQAASTMDHSSLNFNFINVTEHYKFHTNSCLSKLQLHAGLRFIENTQQIPNWSFEILIEPSECLRKRKKKNSLDRDESFRTGLPSSRVL